MKGIAVFITILGLAAAEIKLEEEAVPIIHPDESTPPIRQERAAEPSPEANPEPLPEPLELPAHYYRLIYPAQKTVYLTKEPELIASKKEYSYRLISEYTKPEPMLEPLKFQYRLISGTDSEEKPSSGFLSYVLPSVNSWFSGLKPTLSEYFSQLPQLPQLPQLAQYRGPKVSYIKYPEVSEVKIVTPIADEK